MVQIRILNIQTNQQSSLGSGFFVTATGSLITNFHVVADVVNNPERYRAEYVDESGATGALRIANVDVPNDLAVAIADTRPPTVLRFATREIRKGERLYSIGNPRGLGLTIVEGSFSGVLQGSLYQRIHYTGSLNPSMSGGPTINAAGEIVGVNVSTAGNQISFLVAGTVAQKLLQHSTTLLTQPPLDFAPVVRDQLDDDQNDKLLLLLDKGFRSSTLGPYQVPSSNSPFLRCWGDSYEPEKQRYSVQSEKCTVDDSTFIAANHESVLLTFRHHYIDGKDLNRWAFAKLYQSFFESIDLPSSADDEHVGTFHCETHFVDHGDLTFKVATCLRSLKKYPGLYDFALNGVALESGSAGLHTELFLGAVSIENADSIMRQYLEAITWAP